MNHVEYGVYLEIIINQRITRVLKLFVTMHILEISLASSCTRAILQKVNIGQIHIPIQ